MKGVLKNKKMEDISSCKAKDSRLWYHLHIPLSVFIESFEPCDA